MSNGQSPKTEKPVINVLSLDGGGVRGLIPLRFLQGLEEATGQPAHKIFHTIVGTSTGGFITALLSLASRETHKPVEAGKALQIYKKVGPEIFPAKVFGAKQYFLVFALFLAATIYVFFHLKGLLKELPKEEQRYLKLLDNNDLAGALAMLLVTCVTMALIFLWLAIRGFNRAKYSGKSVVNFCEGHFCSKAKLKDAFTNVGICATDLKKRRSFVFNSMRSKINHDCPLHSVEIAKIARATSAAPTFFKPQFFTIVDDNNVNQGENGQKKTITVQDLKREMTPWDSRDAESKYDRKWVAFEDGGTKMNNPSKAALKLAQLQLKQEGKNPDDYEIRLLSVGTGSLSGRQEDPTAKPCNGILHWLAKKGILTFLDNMYHQEWTGSLVSVVDRRLTGDVFEVLINAHNDHLEVKQAYKENGNDNHYRRQQFKISKHQLDNMDDCSGTNMDRLIERAEDMMITGGDNGQEQKKKEWSKEFKDCVAFLNLEIVNELEDLPQSSSTATQNGRIKSE